ncbi:hypothetical protein [Gloeothece verrucosa]|uniref:Uncharacterized protein n=1 Tax=Gloeothece verrucosa (strain PCC 7822) TaxID=497965 RepID=E0U9G5_GLOV7|nr:hypothetical protein [Gloeothece verrucosa]ADN12657.1 hypothetical protein Cyan7822_0621 [Gloeothece verrucosa PCC 7822]
MMKRVIKGLLAFTFAIVVACGFQALPAHAQDICQVCQATSTNPCIIELTDTRVRAVRVETAQDLLVVIANNDFERPVKITVGVSGVQETISLQPNQSVLKNYPYHAYPCFTIQANSPVGSPNVTIVAAQADSQGG